MENLENFFQICNALKENPTKKIWLDFADKLKYTNIKHYSITYAKGKVDTEQDLTTSYATLYDEIGKEIISIPIYMKDGTQVRGALFFLRGLTRTKNGGSE